MTKEFHCSDGMQGCDYVVRGKDENEVMQNAAQHGKDAHGLNEIPSDVQQKVRSGIHDSSHYDRQSAKA
jgi:predicted small metal-binding protein